MDHSPPGSSVRGVLKARTLEWVATLSSRGSSHPGIEPESPALADRFFTTEPPGKPFIGAPINHVLGVWGREIRDLDRYFLFFHSNII